MKTTREEIIAEAGILEQGINSFKKKCSDAGMIMYCKSTYNNTGTWESYYIVVQKEVPRQVDTIYNNTPNKSYV